MRSKLPLPAGRVHCRRHVQCTPINTLDDQHDLGVMSMSARWPSSWADAWNGIQDAAAYEAAAPYRRLMESIKGNPPDVDTVHQMYGNAFLQTLGDGTGRPVTDDQLLSALDLADRMAHATYERARDPGLPRAEEVPIWTVYEEISFTLLRELRLREVVIPGRLPPWESAPSPQDADGFPGGALLL